MTQAQLLIEIGCEEIPAKLLPQLSQALEQNITQQLNTANLTHDKIQSYSTPRRLALSIPKLQTQQQSTTQERKGPATTNAYDDKGNPTPALKGFAKSCNISLEKLTTQTIGKNEYVIATVKNTGKHIKDLLPNILNTAIKKLPIPKPMRWGDTNHSFIRPVHWLVALLDDQIIECEIFGCQSGRTTSGHRFHCSKPINLKHAKDYENTLKKQGNVIANPNERQQMIVNQMTELTKNINGNVVINENLLTEVTGLVEWPNALLIEFDKTFLQVPSEALIAAMHSHQKCFHITNKKGDLLPYFITISNINSQKPEIVKSGNARVMRARLNDAAFFYQTDLKKTLDDRLENLKTVVFQEKLGSLHDKATRISKLSGHIAKALNETTGKQTCDPKQAARAATLAKCDLVTEMVYEFPELQGIMGHYYAKAQQEPAPIAQAIQEHYLPRYAKDQLPESIIGATVAIADRLDTLIGIFGIGEQPTGDKDPFALRRAALGIIRILFTQKWSLDLENLIRQTVIGYQTNLTNQDVVQEVTTFILERLKVWYQDQGIDTKVIQAVLALKPTNIIDCEQRIQAITQFSQQPTADTVIELNKRIKNILRKAEIKQPQKYNNQLLTETAEKQLASEMEKAQQQIAKHQKQGDYTKILNTLMTLKDPVHNFFEKVMVMVEDTKIRNNRLALLNKLRQLFIQIADLSLLK